MLKNRLFVHIVLFFLIALSISIAKAQDDKPPMVLTGAALRQIMPTSFYFEGQSAPTQIRNSSAVRFAKDRHIIVGLVDTSGYSTEIAAKYQGFFITDSTIKIGGKELTVGAYDFGFTSDGKFNILDIGGTSVLGVTAAADKNLRLPRPLMIMKTADEIRLYSGRNFVTLSP